MALVESTTTNIQLRYPGNRRIERQTRTGHLFYVSYGSAVIQVYRSTDNGATWAPFGGQRPAAANIVEMGSFFVDWQNRLYFTYRTNVSNQDRVYLDAAVITPNYPSWHALTLVASAANGGVAGAALTGMALTIVRHNDGRTTGAVGVGTNGASIGVTLYGFTIPTYGQPILNNSVVAGRRSWTANESATGHSVPAMGYELSPAHMWVTFGRTYLYSVKCTWNGQGWNGPQTAARITPGTVGVSTAPAANESCASVWRNPGWMVAQPYAEDNTVILLSERSQSDTRTTYKFSLTHPTGVIRNCALALNNQTRDVRVYAVGTSTDVLYYCDYIAMTGSFSSWAIAVPTPITGTHNYSVRRENYQSSNFDLLTLSGAGPYPVTHTAQKALYAPFVPSWNEAAMGRPNGAAADVNSTLLLQWNFADPDGDDVQAAWALSRVIGAGAIQYFRASDSTWQATEQKNIGASTSVNLAAAWGTDGGAAHTYQVKAWDSTDLASNYSVGYVLLPSAKANPSLSLSEVRDINPGLDTGFETGTVGFAGFNGTLTQSSTFAHTGTKSAKLVTAAALNPKITRTGNDPVTTGQQYTFDAWLYAPASLGASTAFVAFDWFNGTTYVSSSTTNVSLPVGAWTNVSVTASAPGGITGCRRSAGIAGTTPAGLELYVDDAMVLSPWSGTIHTDTIVASWFVTEMSAYRVTLSTNPGGEQVYDSGWQASTVDFTHPIPYRLPDGTTWTVGLQTRNNDGLVSNMATAGFFVDFQEPPTPTCTLTPIPDEGVIRVAIDNPAPVGGQPEVSEQSVYRRPRRYTNLLPNPGFELTVSGSGWIAQDGTGGGSTAQAHTGSWSYIVTPNGTGLFPRADGPYVALTGTMRAGGWVRAQAGTSPLQVAIHAFDASGGYLTTRGQRRSTAVVGQWVYLETTADFGDLPTAALCTIAIGRGDGVAAPPAGDIFHVDDTLLMPYDPDDGVPVASGRLSDAGALDTVVSDTYTRTVANGWGTPNTGSPWVVSGGPTTDFSVDGNVGKMLLGSVATARRGVTPATKDIDVVSTIIVPVIPTGAGINVGVLARYTDDSNFYLGELMILTDLTITARIRKSVAGSFTTVLTSAAIPGLSHSTSKTYRLRFVVEGVSLRVRIWDNATVEPAVWHLDVVDTSLSPASSQVGFRAATDVGNTNNAPFPTISYDAFLAQGTSGGGSSASTVDDWHPTSGVEYEYRVLAQASNGTSAVSPWTI